jgi:PAS domain S-box-containing protein
LERIVQHHELVLNSIQTGIFVISRSGRIIQANAAAGDLSRKEAKQLAGKSISSLLMKGDDSPREWDSHFLCEFVREGKAARLKEARLKQADGSILPVQIACHPTHDREKLTGAVVTVRAQAPVQ